MAFHSTWTCWVIACEKTFAGIMTTPSSYSLVWTVCILQTINIMCCTVVPKTTVISHDFPKNTKRSDFLSQVMWVTVNLRTCVCVLLYVCNSNKEARLVWGLTQETRLVQWGNFHSKKDQAVCQCMAMIATWHLMWCVMSCDFRTGQLGTLKYWLHFITPK